MPLSSRRAPSPTRSLGCGRGESCRASPVATSSRSCARARVYSDDPVFLVVGVERTLRALRAWRRLTTSAGLIMAIPEKRCLGSWAKWLGVIIVAALGIVIVPKDKILRAMRTITIALGNRLEFSSYRSLCGLLEHFRAVNLSGRNVMHGLYQPHGPDGASRDGPDGIVRCTPLMTKQLQRMVEEATTACDQFRRAATLY